MLGTQDRQTYLDLLKVPLGFQLDQAVATTYSLDLMALLVLPLSFARFEVDNALEALRDPVILLDTLRSYADRITVFCQQGQIHVPPANQLLFSYLEPMVVEARSPNPEGAFHAKTWLLRFVEADGDKVIYRFLCLSKNLTVAHSWDTAFSIEGVLTKRKLAIGRMNPLGDFYAALSDLAVHRLGDEKTKTLERIQSEVRRTRFRLQDPLDEHGFRLWPLGIPGHIRSPFKGRIDQALIISPFLSASLLSELSEAGRGDILISLQQSLVDVGESCLSRFGEVHVLDEHAVDFDASPPGIDSTEESSEEMPGRTAESGESLDRNEESFSEAETGNEGVLTGSLHAKLFVTKQGWDSRLWTGSANATVAALPHVQGYDRSSWGRNVEFLVELKGRSSLIGIEKILGSEDEDGSLRRLLIQYRPSEPVSEEEQLRKKLEDKLEDFRRKLLLSALQLQVVPAPDSGKFDVVLLGSGFPALPEGFEVNAWPVSLQQEKSQTLNPSRLKEGLVFEGVSCVSLSTFMAFEIRGQVEKVKSVLRFVLNLPTEGLPEDRSKHVLRSILADRERFIRYLLMILGEDEIDVMQGLMQMGEGRGWGNWKTCESIPLLEELVRAVARNPEKIDRIEKLVEELRESEDGASILPEGFDAIWAPILEVRKRQKA